MQSPTRNSDVSRDEQRQLYFASVRTQVRAMQAILNEALRVLSEADYETYESVVMSQPTPVSLDAYLAHRTAWESFVSTLTAQLEYVRELMDLFDQQRDILNSMLAECLLLQLDMPFAPVMY